MKEVGSRGGAMVIPSMEKEKFTPKIHVQINPKEDNEVGKLKYGQDYVEKVAAMRRHGAKHNEIQETLCIASSGTLHNLIKKAKEQGLVNDPKNVERKEEAREETDPTSVKNIAQGLSEIVGPEPTPQVTSVEDPETPNIPASDSAGELDEQEEIPYYMDLAGTKKPEPSQSVLAEIDEMIATEEKLLDSAKKYRMAAVAASEIFGDTEHPAVHALWNQLRREAGLLCG